MSHNTELSFTAVALRNIVVDSLINAPDFTVSEVVEQRGQAVHVTVKRNFPRPASTMSARTARSTRVAVREALAAQGYSLLSTSINEHGYVFEIQV